MNETGQNVKIEVTGIYRGLVHKKLEVACSFGRIQEWISEFLNANILLNFQVCAKCCMIDTELDTNERFHVVKGCMTPTSVLAQPCGRSKLDMAGAQHAPPQHPRSNRCSRSLLII